MYYINPELLLMTYQLKKLILKIPKKDLPAVCRDIAIITVFVFAVGIAITLFIVVPILLLILPS